MKQTEREGDLMQMLGAEMGRRARHLADLKRLKLKDIAESTGLEESQISRFLGGHQAQPTIQTVVRVANAIGASVDDLLPRELRGPVVTRLRPRPQTIEARVEALEIAYDALKGLPELVEEIAEIDRATQVDLESRERATRSKPAARRATKTK